MTIKKPCEYFKDKKVVQMGLGLLGRAIGDAEFIASCNPKEFIITDIKSKEELKESLDKLQGLNINFKLGGHDIEDFKNADVLLKGAGVPLDSEYVQAAKESGAQVFMSTALAAKYAQDIGMTVVGITGTRGKSTVTHMIYDSLKRFRKDVEIFLGGNVKGVSTLKLTDKFKAGDILVLELDSWQLQGFGDLKISPNIAVFTNFYPDHQNYYKSMEKYFSDKANIFKYQSWDRADLLVVSDEVYDLINAQNPPVEPMEASRIPEEWELQVPGTHMRANAALALEVLSQLGLSMQEIKEALESFKGVPGRLEYLESYSKQFGFDIYNDNNATSPEATVAAIEALSRTKKEGQNLILIVGGSDKGLDLEKLATTINEKVNKVFLYDGTGSQKLEKMLHEYEKHESFYELIEKAISNAKKGDILLFSPAFASFGREFKNEYDREGKFLAALEKLAQAK